MLREMRVLDSFTNRGKMRKKFFCILIFIALMSPLLSSTRPAVESDVPELHKLISELVVSEGHEASSVSATYEDLRFFGFGERPFFFAEVAETDGKIVGYALYFFSFSASQGRPILYLKDLYVKSEYRGCGLGTQLVKQLARYAQKHNCCRMEWLVSDWNEGAIAFYEKLGAELNNSLVPVRMGRGAIDHLAKEDNAESKE